MKKGFLHNYSLLYIFSGLPCNHLAQIISVSPSFFGSLSLKYLMIFIANNIFHLNLPFKTLEIISSDQSVQAVLKYENFG
jgi:hypothetical protein